MTLTRSVESQWNKAGSLKERVRTSSAPIHELALKRLERWKEFVESDDTVSLQDVLDTHQLNREMLLHLLSEESVEIVGDHNWKSMLNEIQAGLDEHVTIPDIEDVLFANFIKPFVQNGVRRLQQRLNKAGLLQEKEQWFSSKAEHSLVQSLAQSLASLSSRTIVLELNVARVSGQLQGETSEARFLHYNRVQLNDISYRSSILNEYVVLARLLALKTLYWVHNTAELYERFIQDRNLLEKEFNQGQPLDLIQNVDTGSNISDSHKQGKTVAIVHFQSGLRIVYKPRVLAVDECFNNLIQQLNHDLSHPLKTVRTLQRTDYGWTEFIHPTSCHHEDEIKRFYWRTGSYLAILYALNAVDFHHQNLIAQGEYPVLIDLESLLHNSSAYTNGSAVSNAHEHIEKSVLRIGLLPRKIGSKQGLDGIDLSGLGAQEGQVSPHKTTVIEDRDKDTIRIVEKNYSIPVSNHRPLLHGETVKVTSYEDMILQGFEETYRILQNNKVQLLHTIEAFGSIPVRQILRGTARYANLLRISLHPNFLRDGLDRDMIMDKLWLDTKLNPNLKTVVHSEQKDMYTGDIPYFYSYPGSRSLFDSRDHEMKDFFKQSALTDIRSKFNTLDAEDCAEQLSFIHTAMLVMQEKTKSTHTLVLPPQRYDTSAFLKEALHIADVLDKRAIRGQQNGQTDIAWIGSFVDNKREDQFKIAPTNTTLYEGSGGIALFLAYAGHISGQEKYTVLAKQALLSVQNQLADARDAGAFGGICSALYILDHIAVLWKDDTLLLQAWEECKDQLAELLQNDSNNDILTGSAGSAIVLLNLHKRLGDPAMLALADVCGERLLANAVITNPGIGWKVEANPAPSSGFSHGAAGIAWALYEVYHATGKEKYKEAADQALQYERSLYLPEKQNWADLKLDDGQIRNGDFVAWCNGAAGIALSRLLMLPLVDSEAKKDMELEASISLNTVINKGFGSNHSLCHGDLGNLDILMTAMEYDESIADKVDQYSQMILHDITVRGWISGFERHNESPSLMMGTAGIGLGLLKIYAPKQIPSILKLQSPFELELS